MGTNVNRWTEADDDFLRDNYACNSNVNIAKVLNRTQGAVFTRARALGLKKSDQFVSDNIHKAQRKSVANNKKCRTKEEKRAYDNEYRRKHNAWLRENEPERYERMLAKHRENVRKLYYKNKEKNE